MGCFTEWTGRDSDRPGTFLFCAGSHQGTLSWDSFERASRCHRQLASSGTNLVPRHQPLGNFQPQVLPLKTQHKHHPSLPSSLGPSTCSCAPNFIQLWPSLAKLGLLMLQADKQSPAGLVLTQIVRFWPHSLCRVGLGTGPKMLMLLDSGPVSVALLPHA